MGRTGTDKGGGKLQGGKLAKVIMGGVAMGRDLQIS